MLNRQPLVDIIAKALTGLITLAVLSIPVIILADIVATGFSHLSWDFFVGETQDAGRSGGIGALIISTLWILGVCLGAALPLGLGCAIYLSEYLPTQSKRARCLGYSLDVLSGIPSIVFGLFGYRFFAIELGLGFSILSGGLALACMVLPLMIRTCEQALRTLPADLREASEALNLSQMGFIRRILLPNAAPGIVVAVIISVGRALAETAVLLFTAGYVTRMPGSWLDSGRALSVHIYDLAMNVPGGADMAAATAIVLIIMLIMINMAARLLIQRTVWKEAV